MERNSLVTVGEPHEMYDKSQPSKKEYLYNLLSIYSPHQHTRVIATRSEQVSAIMGRYHIGNLKLQGVRLYSKNSPLDKFVYGLQIENCSFKVGSWVQNYTPNFHELFTLLPNGPLRPLRQ